MVYTDPAFVFVFAVLLVAAAVLRRQPRAKAALVAAFSALVIASWGVFDLCLFLAIITANYMAAGEMQRSGPGAARAWLAVAIVFDLGMLAAFKYPGVPGFAFGIPLAISFYVFHAISYLVDVHAGRVAHAPFGRYVFYMSFFPHVIAGPIVRAWQLAQQVERRRPRAGRDMAMGFHFLVTGAFLKLFCANNIAQGIDPFWQRGMPFVPTAADHWAAAFLYYCQIYADFAGYSLMALGMARLLGYRLPANFRTPMLAASLRDFWRRWHITLSRWLRDYLYIPLGGSHHGHGRAALAVMATMLLGGLWHGAAWGFVLWGAMHGAMLVLERALGCHLPARSRVRLVGWWLLVQAWVTLAWVVFRAGSLGDALLFVGNMAALDSWHVHAELAQRFVFALPVLAHQLAPWALRALGRKRLAPALGLATGAMLVCVLVLDSPSSAFIYFRF